MRDELQPEFLLRAYSLGAFPMADDAGGISWYSPDPRAVIELERFKIARSLRQRLKKRDHEIRFDTCFEKIIRHCADRPEGTWISGEIVKAYCKLHELGFAHSVEAYFEGELAGGLYGVSIRGAFFGESMFTLKTDGSKLALVALVERMRQRQMTLLDTQFLTPHLAGLGASEISRAEYLRRLAQALKSDSSFVDQASG